MAAKLVSRCLIVGMYLVAPVIAWGQLPRQPAELLLIGDSVTAGTYFLQLDAEGMRQAWSGQLVRRLGMEVPPAPYNGAFPIDHLRLAKNGFGFAGSSYAWEGRRAFFRGNPQYKRDEERVVFAVPGQTLEELLYQSSLTKDLNKGSSGWTFGNIMLPKGMSAIETVEGWKERPRWIVVFIGANDLLASFGLAGHATPTPVASFREHYQELVGRLRNRMAPGAPAEQLILMTLPDVTQLPFIQNVPEGSSNGDDVLYPAGSKASAFLIPFRAKKKAGGFECRFEQDEVWTPDELALAQERVGDYNRTIADIANDGAFTLVDVGTLQNELALKESFSAKESRFFSPDLHHPSYRTHRVIADAVLETMAKIAGVAVPDTLAPPDQPLPSAFEMQSNHERTDAMMHLAVQGLEAGPLPPRLTMRVALEIGAQGGTERVGEVVFSPLIGVEFLPVPITTHRVMRLCANARGAIAALQASNEDTDFFPKRSFELRLGLGIEKIGGWNWSRWEFGGLITPDDSVDGGMYLRNEWRIVYAEISSRGWTPDRFEIGVRMGLEPFRPGHNGN